MKPRALFVAAEAIPLAKTGGLADVVGALSDGLNRRGVDVTVLLPGYPQALRGARALREVARLPERPGLPGGARVLAGTMPDTNVRVALLEMDWLFGRDGTPYADPEGNEFADNSQRFAALAHAAVDIAAGRTRLPVPHVVHVHDWHTGLVPMLMKDAGLKQPTIMTIHNLAFQGVFPREMDATLGLPPALRADPGLEYWGQISFMKAGLAHADEITTVSPTYATEVLTPRFGHGMDGLLRERSDRLRAIRNGVDTEEWNPAADGLITREFNARDTSGRVVCKRALQAEFGLEVDPFAPVLALGSRITEQKMADVALAALAKILDTDARLQVAVLGKGDRALEQGFLDLAARWPGRVGVQIGYSEAKAHALHAGSDMLLHGSRFEPFGLTPVYAMRYGCVPIVSRVGGLVDTVHDVGSFANPNANATGFTFDGETPEDMHAAIQRALQWFARPAAWRILQRNGMRSDFGWDAPAADYIATYRELYARADGEAQADAVFGRPLVPSANSDHLVKVPVPSSQGRVAMHGG